MITITDGRVVAIDNDDVHCDPMSLEGDTCLDLDECSSNSLEGNLGKEVGFGVVQMMKRSIDPELEKIHSTGSLEELVDDV